MPRIPRDEEAGAIHHVVPQGTGRRRIVEDDRDRLSFLDRFVGVAEELEWIVHANCLMDTHQHAVVETTKPNLGVGMKRVQGGHARYLNLRHGREGHVFQQRFWSRRLFDDGALLSACLYAVLNPVAAGLCRHPLDWPWCSYAATVHGDPTVYATGEERLLGMFGRTPGDARARYARVVTDAAEAIRKAKPADGKALLEDIAAAAAKRARLGV